MAHSEESQPLVFAARTGALVWTAYGVVELAILAVLPWMIPPRENYRHFDVAYSALLLAIYAVAGALVGVLAGAVLERWVISFREAARVDRKFILSAVVTALILITVELQSPLPQAGLSLLRYAVSKGTALALILLLAAAVRDARLQWLASPGAVFGLFLGILSVPDLLEAMEWRGTVPKIAGILFVSVGVVLCAALMRRLTRALPVLSGAPMLLTLAAGTLACTGLFEAGSIDRSLSASRASASKPNVILIVLDTVSAEHMSLYGGAHKTTPNLERLASQATLYQHAAAAGDMSLQSHASIFTGLYPIRHGAHYTPAQPLGSPLSLQQQTLAERLAAVGFATSALSANFVYVNPDFGLDQGFEHFENFTHYYLFGGSDSPHFLRKAVERYFPYFPRFASALRASSDLVNVQVFRTLDQLQSRNQPFFLFVNYMDAHFPYDPGPPFETAFQPAGTLPTIGEFWEMRKQVAAKGKEFAAPLRQRLVPRYEASIAFLDLQLGRLLDDLRKRNLFDKSLIVITSDHGEGFGEKGYLEHGMSAYQDQVWVPLLVKFPNQKAPQVVSQPVSHVDIVPTVLEAIGTVPPNGLDGVSLMHLDQAGGRAIYAESYPGTDSVELKQKKFQRIQRAIFTGGSKLLSSTNSAPELYDLKKDPMETRDLYRPEDTAAVALDSRLQNWEKTVVPAIVEQPKKIDGDTLQRLKSLGYVGGGSQE